MIKQRSQAQPHLTTFMVFKDTLYREVGKLFPRSKLKVKGVPELNLNLAGLERILPVIFDDRAA